MKTTICGEVMQAEWTNLYGWVVSVTNGNITTLYGHNSQLLVAAAGCTGRCPGPHVHYGVSVNDVWVDPIEAFGIG